MNMRCVDSVLGILIMTLLIDVQQVDTSLCDTGKTGRCYTGCMKTYKCLNYERHCCVDVRMEDPKLDTTLCLCCRKNDSVDGCPIQPNILWTSVKKEDNVCHCDSLNEDLNKKIASVCERPVTTMRC